MEEFKQGGKAWISGVWTKTELRNKVHTMISEVTITKLFDEDKSCLVTDGENIGIYCNVKDLFATQKDALEDVFKGLERWHVLEKKEVLND